MDAGATDRLLAMFRVIEISKHAVGKFESGDANVREAIRLIRDAIAADDRGHERHETRDSSGMRVARSPPVF